MPSNVIEIVLKAVDQATKPLKDISVNLTSFKGILATLGGGFVLHEFIKNTEEAQQATLQLRNALKLAGDQAGMSEKDAEAFSQQIQQLTIFSDEAAKQAETLGLRLGLTGDTLKRVVKDAADLASATGGDLVSSMESLGKAIADPQRGLINLRREGIVLSASQQFLVSQLAKTGDKAGAQKIILEAVEKSYKGAAEAATQTLGGALKQLGDAFGDLFEQTETQTSGATDAIKELTKTVRDPEIKKGFDELAGGMAKLAEKTAEVLANAPGFARFLGESLAHAIGGADTQIGKLQDQLEEVDKQLAARKSPRLGVIQAFKEMVGPSTKELEGQRSKLLAQIGALQDEQGRASLAAQRASKAAADAASSTTAGSGKGPLEFSLEQLEAIKNVTEALDAQSDAFAVQAKYGTDSSAALDRVGIKATLAKVGLKGMLDQIPGLNAQLSKLAKERAAAAGRELSDSLAETNLELEKQLELGPKAAAAVEKLQAAFNLKSKGAKLTDSQSAQIDANNAIKSGIAQSNTLRTLQDQTLELELQAKLHGQALDDALQELQIAHNLRDQGSEITKDIQDRLKANSGKRDSAVVADLQDQLHLAQLTSDELEKEVNRRKLSADATDQQKQSTDQLTDAIRHATSVTQTWNSIVSDVKEAFGNLLESGSLSIKSLTRTIIIELEKREIYEAIDNIAKYLRNAFKSASSSGGGGIGSTIIAGIGHLFGFAGGGHPKGLAVVGENGPELANFGGGGQVWNKSELAFAGAGGGISYAPQTYITIEAKDTDANSLRKEFYSVLALNNAKQEKNFQQTLRENGFGRLR